MDIALLSGMALYYTINTSNNKKNNFNVLQYRNPNSYSKKTKDLINLVTIQEDINPVGSQKFKVARYPGDIDIMEPIINCCSLEDVVIDVSKSIQKIATKIKNTPKVYLGDFKAGLDNRYNINIGDINAYDKVVGYKRTKVIKYLKELFNKGLLTSDDLNTAFKYITKNFSRKSWEKLAKFIKHFRVIRWSLDELISGQKFVGKGANKVLLKLSEALKEETITKLDLWGQVDNRYTEITNFFLLSYFDTNGVENTISPSLTNYKERIVKDLKHYGQGTSYQPLKMAKRLWALAVSLNDTSVLEKLYPLFSSEASILYQINAEIETIVLMLENWDSIGEEIIADNAYIDVMNQIDEYKMRLSMVYNLTLDDQELQFLIDEASNKDIRTKKGRKAIIKSLDMFSEILQIGINEFSEEYLQSVNLLNPNYYDHLLIN